MSRKSSGPAEAFGGTGLDEVKQVLLAGFPEDCGLDVQEFIQVESLLALAADIGGDEAEAESAHLLLSNYVLLKTASFRPAEHRLQMARRHLMPLSSSTTWHKLLDLYLGDAYAPIRAFGCEDGRIIRAERPYGGIDRSRVYLEWLASPAPLPEGTESAVPSKAYFFYCKPEGEPGREVAAGEMREVWIPRGLRLPEPDTRAREARKGPREPIDVSLSELIEVAEQLGTVGRGHHAGVLRSMKDQGLLKHLSGGLAQPSEQLRLERVVNLVGLVGAGKSVLADALTVLLARKGYKVVVILGSVPEIFEKLGFLVSAGVKASPLVSNRERVQRLNELRAREPGMMFHDAVSRYLETPCPVDGLGVGESDACSYGDVPCFGLKSGTKRFACPFWGVCPTQAMSRDALASDVVVTTAAGFSMMTAGRNRAAFFQYVLASFDLAIFDEADRVQAQLDSEFAPEVSTQELIRRFADPVAEAMKRPPSVKLANLNVEYFYDLRQSSEIVLKSLLLAAKTAEIKNWAVVKNRTFTSLTLVNALEDELPEPVLHDLRTCVGRRDGRDPLISAAIDLACNWVSEDAYASALSRYLESKQIGKGLSSTLKARLSFALKVLRFDDFLRELASASERLDFSDDAMTGLYGFLRASFKRQQPYLPSSPIGNVFGMKLTDDSDLIIFRQFAYGRAFMTALPWLDTDEEGRPCGPHALLLSGSSYEPGSLQYHVNKSVDYLLEAQPWVAEKLERSKVRELGLAHRVSGSQLSERPVRLRGLLAELAGSIAAELGGERAGKALVIVNSYTEAGKAAAQLETMLRSEGFGVVALCKSGPDDAGRVIRRSEIQRFASSPAHVLVAPALAIERGYNIVDDAGHAVFSSLFFAARPMGAPNDLGARFRRVNGYMEARALDLLDNPAEFCKRVRAEAWGCWRRLERAELAPPGVWRRMGCEFLLRDVMATMLATIIQVFGRLARIADCERPAPHVYFADAAFRGPDDDASLALRTLDELRMYMAWLMEESEQPAVAKALYGPFYTAFEKGID